MTHASTELTTRRWAHDERHPLPDPDTFGRTEQRRRRALAWGFVSGAAVANGVFWSIAYGSRWALELPAAGALLAGLIVGAGVWRALSPSRERVSWPAEAELTDVESAALNASFAAAPPIDAVTDEPEDGASRRELEAELRQEASAQRRARLARGLPWMIGVPSFVGAFALASSWIPIDTAVGIAMPPAVLFGVLVRYLLDRRPSEASR
ncbi:MAG: hypothetical protein RLP09_08920 [Sandaracinaceae bacterium]